MRFAIGAANRLGGCCKENANNTSAGNRRLGVVLYTQHNKERKQQGDWRGLVKGGLGKGLEVEV